MSCDCIYCFSGKPHPVTHTETYEFEIRKDVWVTACMKCGHIKFS